jgi:hypothetical protein
LILILGHYFNQRPLWNDEQCVLNNIIQLKPADLFTRPLLNDQAFPRLYLWVIQQFSYFFNHSLLALRFLPWLAMLGAFFVWIKIARRVLDHPWDLIVFIGCWSASMPLVYYAAELKPYSMDVLACGIIVSDTIFYSSRNCQNINGVRHYFLLPLLGLVSYPALFLLLLPLYNLVRECIRQHRWLPPLSIYLGSYALVLGFVYFFDFRDSAHYLMEEFWHDYFISLDSFKTFFSSFGKGMANLTARRFAEHPRWVKAPSEIFIGLGIGYMLAVFWGQWKKDRFNLRSIVPVGFAILLLQLLQSLLRVYPLAVPRMSLFYTPLLLLMTIMFLRWLCQQNKAWGVILKVIFAGYLLFVSGGIAWDVFLKGDLGAESTLYSPG